MSLERVHILIPRRNFAIVIKLSILQWRGYPGLFIWAQYSHKGPFKKEAEEAE